MKAESITRRRWLGAAGAVTIALALPAEGGTKNMQEIREMLEKSLKEKKGVTLYLAGGQTVGGGVTSITLEAVQLRSQQYSSIVVLLDKIEAAAMA